MVDRRADASSPLKNNAEVRVSVGSLATGRRRCEDGSRAETLEKDEPPKGERGQVPRDPRERELKAGVTGLAGFGWD